MTFAPRFFRCCGSLRTHAARSRRRALLEVQAAGNTDQELPNRHQYKMRDIMSEYFWRKSKKNGRHWAREEESRLLAHSKVVAPCWIHGCELWTQITAGALWKNKGVGGCWWPGLWPEITWVEDVLEMLTFAYTHYMRRRVMVAVLCDKRIIHLY